MTRKSKLMAEKLDCTSGQHLSDGLESKSVSTFLEPSVSFCSEMTFSHGDAQVTEGWLTKVGRYWHVHSSRYLKLRGAALSCFRSPERDPVWTINLLNCSVRPSFKSKNFVISTPDRSLEYCAASEAERDRWVAVLRKATMENIFSFYKVGAVIGSGSFSCVRLGASLDTRDIRKYAVKVIDKKRLRGSFHCMDREIEILRSVQHNNIVQVFDIFETDKRLMIVLEYCPDGDLFEKLRQRSTLSEYQAIHVFRQLFSALSYLHCRGIVHRDIKPANFLCADSLETVKLSDFGLSRTLETTDDALMTSVVGTPAFVAPEVIGKLPHDEKVDIWGMGVSLYLLLSGCLPFDGTNRDQLYNKIQSGEVEFHGNFWESISFEAKDLIQNLLAKNPKDRISASQALKHPWFNSSSFIRNNQMQKDLQRLDPLDSASFSSISKYQSPSTLTMLPNACGSQSSMLDTRRLSM
eukprot:CAMPEP_0182443134 /NCGR_PEP_ID=MMETSP1172-20130603/1941_1 /TAXON_ID=708627 /ORGANISM="Timspurckia oligopyrenoides, Strain CCMP3278" /LENGTH=464 /DNA_ID=CAMNT_0024638301 /DNA_START=174 /DNA_END=1568 /DNA_ORIENTATION=-